MVVWVRWGVAVLRVFCDFFLFLNEKWTKYCGNELCYSKIRTCFISTSYVNSLNSDRELIYKNIREKSTLKIITKLIFEFLRLIFRSKQDLVMENMALRQQLLVQQRGIKRPKIKKADRIFWVWMLRIWKDWKSALMIVNPPTVIGWHKKGFKLYWKRKSRRVGRPNIDWQLIKLIRKRQKENPILPKPPSRKKTLPILPILTQILRDSVPPLLNIFYIIIPKPPLTP